MATNQVVFRALLAMGLTLAVLTLPLVVLQEPGTEGYVVSVLSLAGQSVLVVIGLVGLYFGWEPFSFLDDD